MKSVKEKVMIGALVVSLLGNVGLIIRQKPNFDQYDLLNDTCKKLELTQDKLVETTKKYNDLQESFDNLQAKTNSKSSSSSKSSTSSSSSNTISLKGKCYEIYKNKSSVESQIKKDAKEKWGTEYDMVKWEQDKQLECYHNILNNIEKMDQDILNQAIKKWDYDFGMIVWEYNKQVNAKNSL